MEASGLLSTEIDLVLHLVGVSYTLGLELTPRDEGGGEGHQNRNDDAGADEPQPAQKGRERSSGTDAQDNERKSALG